MFSDSDLTDSYRDHTTSPSITNPHFFHSPSPRNLPSPKTQRADSRASHSSTTSGDDGRSLSESTRSSKSREMPSLELLLAFLEEEDATEGGGGPEEAQPPRGEQEMEQQEEEEEDTRAHSTPSPSLRAAKSFSLRSTSSGSRHKGSVSPSAQTCRRPNHDQHENGNQNESDSPDVTLKQRVGSPLSFASFYQQVRAPSSPLAPAGGEKEDFSDKEDREGNAEDADDEDEDDSVAKLADEVLKEFETIVSPAIPDPERPPSRLRSIPSPPSSSSSHDHDHDQSPGEPRKLSDDSSIRQELAGARAYISQLQQELREVTKVVKSLAVHDSEARPSSSARRRADLQRASEDDDLVSVARHIITLLPSSPRQSPTELHSLALALQFTREIDELVWKTLRRDEEIFREENVVSLGERVGRWEEVVRGRRR